MLYAINLMLSFSLYLEFTVYMFSWSLKLRKIDHVVALTTQNQSFGFNCAFRP